MNNTIVIAQALAEAKNLLSNAKTPVLDAEVLLAFVLNVSRSYLYTWPEKTLSEEDYIQYVALIERAHRGEPIAYITGHQEFWSLDLLVTPAVLIPRSETELLVEKTLELLTETEEVKVADLGTGSGAIALAIAKEKPNWKIVATDQSNDALKIARENAARCNIDNVRWFCGNWCAALPPDKFDMIVSNPPYICTEDPCLDQNGLPYEPKKALVSEDSGLWDIQMIVAKAQNYLKLCSYLLIEHGCGQGKSVRELLSKFGYQDIVTSKDLANLERITVAKS